MLQLGDGRLAHPASDPTVQIIEALNLNVP
jgi:hypothetical protein